MDYVSDSEHVAVLSHLCAYLTPSLDYGQIYEVNPSITLMASQFIEHYLTLRLTQQEFPCF